MQFLTESSFGELIFTILVSMLPLVELRGGIPFGVGLGLDYWIAFFACVIGNMIPVPFIVVYIRRIFAWLRKKSPRLNRFVTKMEARAHLKGRLVKKYRFLGLFLFVAIPLPGTGAWTGALIAAGLDMRLRDAIPAILLGVIIAGILISVLTFGVVSLF